MDDGIVAIPTYQNHLVNHLEANPPPINKNSHDTAILFMVRKDGYSKFEQ